MEAKACDLDGGKVRAKRHRDGGDNDEKKKKRHKKEYGAELLEADGHDREDFKERGKRHRRHGSKERGKRRRRHGSKERGKRRRHHGSKERGKRHRPYAKEKFTEDDKRDHCSDQREKGDVDNSCDLDLETQSYGEGEEEEKEEGFHGRNNRDLERWQPRRGHDWERYHPISDKEGSRNKSQIKESGKPSRKGHQEEEKDAEKKRTSAWLIEETEKEKKKSPVTLSDIEFSTDIDSRVVNREFKIAQDYCPSKTGI